jgi:hypothetical protein
MASGRVPYVWVMLVGDTTLADQVFVKASLAGCADVSDVSERACEKLGLGLGAPSRCRLYLAAAGSGVDEPSADSIKDALSGERLQSSWPLERARIVAGSWLLARVPPLPAHELQASIQSAVSTTVTSSMSSAIASYVESRRSSTSSVAAQPSLGDEQLHGSVSGFDALRERMARLPVPGAVGGWPCA